MTVLTWFNCKYTIYQKEDFYSYVDLKAQFILCFLSQLTKTKSISYLTNDCDKVQAYTAFLNLFALKNPFYASE